MKKLFILSVLSLGAMTLNAQLQLLHTFDSAVYPYYGYLVTVNSTLPDAQYVISTDTTSTTITSHFISLSTFQEEKSMTINKQVPKDMSHSEYVDLAFKNFWFNDNFIYVLIQEHNKTQLCWYLCKEDGTLIQNFGEVDLFIVPSTNGYLLFAVQHYATPMYTKVYAIPGNGQPTDLEAPTAQTRTSNARKVVENGQMYIILDGVKYAVTGSTTL